MSSPVNSPIQDSPDPQAPGAFTVVYSTDDRYAWLAGISMESLLQCHRGVETLEIIVLDNAVSSVNRQKLLATAARYGRPLRFIDVVESLARLQSLKVSTYSSISIYARFFVADLLPEISGRILYLDCDTLVCDRLDGLLSLPMQGMPIGMILDCLRNEYKRVIGLPENAPYYNSGVLLIDLERWRLARCKERIIDHMLHIRSNYALPDQDLLNIVLKDDIVRIPARFNLLSQMLLHDHAGLKTAYGLRESYWIGAEELEEARRAPAIYHFSGNTLIRPWFANSRHPMAAEYHRRIRESEWANTPLSPFRAPLPYRIQLFGYRFLPRRLFVWMSACMQRCFLRFFYHV